MGCTCFVNSRKKQSKKAEEEEIDLMDKKEKLKEKLELLYKSYYEAKTYFCSNDLKEKEVDAIQKLKKIKAIQKSLNEGNSKEINIKELPKEITPQYITGYTDEERKKKIEELLNRLKSEKEDAENSLNKNLEDLKKKN